MGGGTGMVWIAGVKEAWKRNCTYQLLCGCSSGLELGCLIEAGEVERVMHWDEGGSNEEEEEIEQARVEGPLA